MTRRLERTTDIDEARASMSTFYGAPMGLTADPPKSFRYEMAAVEEAGMDVASLRFGGSCRSGTDSFPDIVVAHAIQGSHRWRIGRESGNGSVPFIVAPHRELMVEFEGMQMRSVCIDIDHARTVARSLSGRDPGAPRTDGLNGESRHHRLVAETLRFVEATLVADNDLGTAPLARAQIIHQAVVSVLTAYPVFDVTADDRGPVPRAVRRAIAFMEEHAHEPITMAEVATAAGVSTRALQSAFHRRFETTPSQYLRRLRLRAAHAELRDGMGPKTSVREVARRWGFLHPGRFAQLYTEEYGERPSQTLRR